MKYIVLFVIFSGCASTATKMNKSMAGVYSGMTTQEFKQQVPKSTLVQMLDNYASYRLHIKSAQFGTPGGYVYETRFFYFKDNVLYRIDEGAKATDLKIEIQSN